MTNDSGHLSPLILDRRALGDLAAEDAQAAESHLASCGACREALESHQENFRRFERFVLPAVLPEIQARARSPVAWRLLWLAPAAAALAAPFLLLPRSAPRETIGVKGGPTLQTFVRRGDQVFSAVDGITLEPGDDLRFVVQPAGLPFLLIVSRDGAGNLTTYYPFGGVESSRLDPAARDELPGSVRLDSTPGKETLYALFSQQPLATIDVTKRLNAETQPSAADLGADSLLHLTFTKAAP